ncbi:MAG: response regulator transcription factor [Hyphomicrobiales bacterium]|nr:MAG: response regulator transcription factor [Hyphomicrobiales bacterium]
MANVLIADGLPSNRRAIKDVVRSVLAPSEVSFFEAANRKQFFDWLSRQEYDVVLLDLCAPKMAGLAELIEIRNLLPVTPVLVISRIDDESTARRAIDCGASGFIPKGFTEDAFQSALKFVLQGGVYMPRINETSFSSIRAIERHANSFTPRQLDVLGLLAVGKANKEIARELGISDLTVKIHITAIFRKLGVATRAKAIVALRGEPGPLTGPG